MKTIYRLPYVTAVFLALLLSGCDQSSKVSSLERKLESLEKEISEFTTALQKFNRHIGTAALPIVGLVPFSNTLSVPRTLDIASSINATWVNEGTAAQRRVLHTSLIASSIEHELNKFVAGELIISASERIDVILAASLATQNGVPLSGLILTEREVPNAQILEFCKTAIQQGLPVLHTSLNTLETAQRLATFYPVHKQKRLSVYSHHLTHIEQLNGLYFYIALTSSPT